MVTAVPTKTTDDLTEFETRVIAARDGDLANYAWAVHGLQIEPYQLAWEEALETRTRLVIICPPDTYKSTTVRLWCERAIGRNPNIRILWLQNSGEQAQKQVMTVGATIKSNNVYKAAFHIQEDEEAQWTKSVLFVKRGFSSPDPTLMATGLNGPYQGLHFDVIVIDDPTNQEDVRSPTTMDSQRQKIRGVVLDRLVEGGRIVTILTRWGADDLVPTFEEMSFAIVAMPVIGDYPWGGTISERRFTEERIERIRQDKGDALFSLTFMCDVQGMLGNIIKREQIEYWDKDSLPEHRLQVFMGIDPAASLRTQADYSCIATVGLDAQARKKYLLDLWTLRAEVPDLRKEILKRAKYTAALRGVGLETSGFQLSIVQDLRREGAREGVSLPIQEIPYRTRRLVMRRIVGIDRDKVGRALYLSAQFSSGRLLIPRQLPLVDGVSLESELCSFPYGRHDDRMDAITFACILADAAIPRDIYFKIGSPFSGRR